TASAAGCCATPPTPASAPSSGARWTCSPTRSSPGAPRTVARANPARSGTPATRPPRPASGTSEWGYVGEREKRSEAEHRSRERRQVRVSRELDLAGQVVELVRQAGGPEAQAEAYVSRLDL